MWRQRIEEMKSFFPKVTRVWYPFEFLTSPQNLSDKGHYQLPRYFLVTKSIFGLPYALHRREWPLINRRRDDTSFYQQYGAKMDLVVMCQPDIGIHCELATSLEYRSYKINPWRRSNQEEQVLKFKEETKMTEETTSENTMNDLNTD